jgi:putative radical SAM enzyme (TIGR03279 family)
MAQFKSEGTIDSVEPGSPASRVGVLPGDKLLSINGTSVKDIVAYQFHQAEPHVKLEVQRAGQVAPLVFAIRKPEQQDLGLNFVDPTFDGIKRCNNHCPFCFVDQNAPGLRSTLDIKDDDFRYSFLYGGFITLTNLKESDWERVNRERLSPLYVSVHATEPEVRRALLGNPRAPEIVPQLRRLGDMGIKTHTQLVLCPGINDGPHLDRSIEDLAAVHPGVQTVGVVPVGLTRFRRNNHYQIKLDIRPYTESEAAAVIDQVETHQRRLRKSLGACFVYLSDEWYILAQRPIPEAREYDGYPQLENGVGMVRQLMEESARTARKLPERLESPVSATVVCGEMAAQHLSAALEPLRKVEGLTLRMVIVKNNTLGGNVTCSGLLFGKEVVASLRGLETGDAGKSVSPSSDLVFLPRRMFDFSGVRTLDEWTIEKFQDELGRPVIKADWTRDVWAAVQRAARGEDCFTPATPVLRPSQLG